LNNTRSLGFLFSPLTAHNTIFLVGFSKGVYCIIHSALLWYSVLPAVNFLAPSPPNTIIREYTRILPVLIIICVPA
jgi:hypothetical protein